MCSGSQNVNRCLTLRTHACVTTFLPFFGILSSFCLFAENSGKSMRWAIEGQLKHFKRKIMKWRASHFCVLERLGKRLLNFGYGSRELGLEVELIVVSIVRCLNRFSYEYICRLTQLCFNLIDTLSLVSRIELIKVFNNSFQFRF